MNLKSFGCSFIFGSDLSDINNTLIPPVASNLTWPAHVAKHQGYNYQCLARPGAGNLQIAEEVLNHAADNTPAVFVIGWTWIDRFDYTKQTVSDQQRYRTWDNWNTIRPTDTTSLAKTYYQHIQSDYRDKLSTLMNIKLVIDTLTQKNIPFIMTYVDALMFDQQWHVTPAILDLQEYVKPYMTHFEGQNFIDWSRTNGYAVSDTLHPLEDAHLAAGNYMIKVFDKQKINDQVR